MIPARAGCPPPVCVLIGLVAVQCGMEGEEESEDECVEDEYVEGLKSALMSNGEGEGENESEVEGGGEGEEGDEGDEGGDNIDVDGGGFAPKAYDQLYRKVSRWCPLELPFGHSDGRRRRQMPPSPRRQQVPPSPRRQQVPSSPRRRQMPSSPRCLRLLAADRCLRLLAADRRLRRLAVAVALSFSY